MKNVARLIKPIGYREGPESSNPLQLLRSAATARQSPGTYLPSISTHPHCCTALASCDKRGVHAISSPHMPEHNARGANARPRGKLGHATHGTCARGPNADVMFVYVWSPYISLGLVIPGQSPSSLPASAFTTVDHAFHLDRQTNKLEISPIRQSTPTLSLPAHAYLHPVCMIYKRSSPSRRDSAPKPSPQPCEHSATRQM